MNIKAPTMDQCSSNAIVYKDDHHIAYACWYPQMGGYAGRCVAIFDQLWKSYSSGAAEGGCVDVLVWHDGEFPFSDDGRDPYSLHHCDPSQFIRFGEFLQEINDKNMVEV